jgi:hypothetical protein
MKRLREEIIINDDIQETAKRAKLLMSAEPVSFSNVRIAVTSGNIEMIERLMNSGASINMPSGYTLMHLAAASGQIETMKRLKDNGTSASVTNAVGYTPMHLAAAFGQIETMKWLKDNGASIDAVNINEHTPLYAAASYGKVEALEWLLKNGAKVSISPNFKFKDSVDLKAKTVTVVNELINWATLADQICNHTSLINPINISSNSHDALFISRIKYNLLTNGLKSDYSRFLEILEKCNLSKNLIDAIKAEINPLVDKAQLDILALEARLMHQIDATETAKPLHELLTLNTNSSGDTIKKILEVYSISYSESSFYIRKCEAGIITDAEKTILVQSLKNEAGNYLTNIPKEKLLSVMAKNSAICESIKLSLKNLLPDIYVKYCLIDALGKHEKNMSNPVVKALCEAQKTLCSKVDELEKKIMVVENKYNNLEDIVSKLRSFLNENNLNLAAQGGIPEVDPMGKEATDFLD